MDNPDKEHWRAVKSMLRYLRRTSSYGLLFVGKRLDDCQILGYIDLTILEILSRGLLLVTCLLLTIAL